MYELTLPNSYLDFKQLVADNIKLPKEVYYQSLIKFKTDILKDLENKSQKDLAKELNINQSVMSVITNLLSACID